MASYATTLAHALRTYDSLWADEDDVLHHLFFVNGNGYRWRDGDLVETDSTWWDNENDEEVPFAFAHVDAWLETQVEKLVAAKPFGALRTKRVSIYPLWEMSHIVCIPNDVKPDWLAAAERAVWLANTFLRKTPTDKKFLALAKERIAVLKAARGFVVRANERVAALKEERKP